MCAKFQENRSTRRLSLRDFKLFAVWCEEEKNTKKMRQLLRASISQTAGTISFKFRMEGGVYVGHKIYKFRRNRRDGFQDTRG